ncbi:hypothetical protein R1flu_007060 [Riccia fluitans]|uniref:MARVEL domain-containing protein n=1 Tax=Riccia fluitans TaxID=41844 RepID=A0ABD1YXS0_9MARC
MPGLGVKAGMGRMINAPFHALDLCLAVIVLGLAGWMMENAIGTGSPFVGFGGNAATPWLSVFSLIAGMVTIASVITSLHHVRVWTPASGAAAQAASWIAWFLLVLPFCLAWKEIQIGGRSARFRCLEGFVITLTFTKFFSTLALYVEEAKETSTTAGKHEAPPTGPGAAPAV